MEMMNELYNGIPLYDWLLLAGALVGLAGSLLLAVGKKEPPARNTARAGNPGRKRSWLA